MDNNYRTVILIAAAVAVLSAGGALPVRADTIVVADQLMVRKSDVARPARGLTMVNVEAKFGAPRAKHAAVGTPAITRWDYPAFAVFFEKDRVIDAVVPGPAPEPAATPASSAPSEPESAAPAEPSMPSSVPSMPPSPPAPSVTTTPSVPAAQRPTPAPIAQAALPP